MMGTPRSPSTDFYGIFGIPKTACKAYKSLFTKRPHHPPHKNYEIYGVVDHKHNDEKSTSNEDQTTLGGFRLRCMDDSSVMKRRSSLLSRTGSRRSHTPQARPTYLSSSASGLRNPTVLSPSKTSPTTFYRSTSRREDSDASLKSRPLSKSTSRREKSPPLSRSSSRRDNVISPIKGVASSPSPSPSRRDDVNGHGKRVTSSVPSTSKSTSIGVGRLSPEMGRSMSRRSTTPIVFSQSVARRKPPPIERKLECTLEELCHGAVKNIKITRDVLTDEGMIGREEEMVRINIKPGWKKGTKITLEGKGNEKPGYLPADIIFSIAEKRHALFKRRGDDLEIAVEIPLLKALTGCKLSVPLLGGENMALSIHDVIYPGFEKAIQGQGMPNAKANGKRGDLRIAFLVNFPDELSDDQRSMAFDVLKDCSWS